MIVRLCCCLLFLITRSVLAECTTPIKLAGLTWESGQFTTAVIKKIIQQGYGCEVTEVSGSSTAQENALMQNDLQLIAEVWQGRSPVLAQAVAAERVQIVGDTLAGGATQAWYIPKYLAEQYPDLRNHHDLFRYASLFKSDAARQKASFLNCPKGWVCEGFNQRLLHNTGLDQVYRVVQPGTGAAMDAEIAAQYAQKKPILFYYWQPAALMAKYEFVPISFPAHDAKCWSQLLAANNRSDCVSGFPSSTLSVAVSEGFARQNPEIMRFLGKLQMTPQQLNRSLLAMREQQHSAETQADLFFEQYPEVWQSWLSPSAVKRFTQQRQQAQGTLTQDFFPHWDMQAWLNQHLNRVVVRFAEPLRHFSHTVSAYLIEPVNRVFNFFPAWCWILLVGALAWHSQRRICFSLMAMLGLFVIGALGLWAALLETSALLLCSVLLTLLIGIPIGIGVGLQPRLYRIVQPVLDVMQTMPSFVYLIPILMLFGLGHVPALFATLIYAIAPLIRLTALGIQQISPIYMETGQAFGTRPWQQLCWVILPLAKPSIMAGINQAVMMSLSMVVLASMIGAPGLGEQVLQAIQTLNVGLGLQSGIAIVILAIIVDRITQAYGRQRKRS